MGLVIIFAYTMSLIISEVQSTTHDPSL